MNVRRDPDGDPVPGTWHLSDDDLRRYQEGDLSAPLLWSVEAHLIGCAGCRTASEALADPVRIENGWARLDAELDAPVPGIAERGLTRLGVPEHIARLLATTPAARGAWLLAVVVTFVGSLAGATGVLRAADPSWPAWAAAAPVVLAAPLLTLLGVAVSFGPRADPAHLMCLVAPMSTLHLLLIRTSVVLASTVVVGLAATLVSPVAGTATVGWLLPCLAVTSCALALTPRWGPVRATACCAVAWVGVVLPSLVPGWAADAVRIPTAWPTPVSAPGQAVLAAVTVAAGIVVWHSRHRFEVERG